MITFTFKDDLSARALTFIVPDREASKLVASFSMFMLAAGYSQKTIDGAFAEMVVLDTVINPPPLTDGETSSTQIWTRKDGRLVRIDRAQDE